MKNIGYTKEELEEIEKKIDQAIQFVKKHNFTIAKCEWGVEIFKQTFIYPDIKGFNWISRTGQCCPGGAVLLANQTDPGESIVFDKRVDAVAKTLGVTDYFVYSFVQGFDASAHISNAVIINDAKSKQGYEMGHKLGRELFPSEVY